MNRTMLAPAGIFESRPFGFAQVTVVRTPFGRSVHVAGQVAWDADRNLVGPGDVGRQLTKCLENVAKALASVGASLDQVGAFTLYVRQSHMKEGKTIADALKATFGDRLPCSTWIGVTGLARDEFLVEVEPSVVFLPPA
ncbi:MAG: RidA family protein [Reyranella sp.]|nr:RidA family protein [Reyranella sp.]